MTNIASKTFLSAFTVAAISGIAMLAQAGTASAKSVTSCEGSSRQSVIECCEVLVQRKGMPLWMKQTGRSCRTSVKCYNTYTAANVCAIRVTDNEGSRKDPVNKRGSIN